MGAAVSSDTDGGGNENHGPSNSSGDSQHWAQLLSPMKRGPHAHLQEYHATVESLTDGEHHAHGAQGRPGIMTLGPKSKVLRKLCHSKMMIHFLESSAESFALTPNELIALLLSSPLDTLTVTEKETIKDEIAAYVDRIKELAQPFKYIDFMSVLSAVMFVSDLQIETKIDFVYKYIALGLDGHDDFRYEDFMIALRSFEMGLSHAMDKKASREEFVRDVCKTWMQIATKEQNPSPDTKMKHSQLYDLCTNRQQPVRRLLEIISKAQDGEPDTGELHEAVMSDKAQAMDPPSGGDEWMANPTWIKTAQKMVPEGMKPNSAKPSASLELEWVHGYRGFDCRNNLRYCDENGNNVVFTAAALVVSQNIDSTGKGNSTQKFLGEHTDDVLCLAYSERTNLIATGEIGKSPTIHLSRYDSSSEKFESLSCMRGLHTKGVVQLAFSANGKLLFSAGVDYTLATYDTDTTSSKFGRLVGSASMKGVCLHLCPIGASNDFISLGEKHVVFWRDTDNKGSYKSTNAKLGEHRNKTFLCATTTSCFGGNSLAAGTSAGDLVLFNDKEATKSQLKVHEKGLNAIWSSQDSNTLVTGGKDGIVIIWKVEGNEISKFSVFEASKYPIRSVCLAMTGNVINKALVGTQTCDILEFQRSDGFKTEEKTRKLSKIEPTVILKSHYSGELWGLSTHPTRPEYCTVGDDKCLRIWSVESRKLLREIDMKAVSRCCTYSPDGYMIAVGYGKGKGKEDGMIRVYRDDPDKPNAPPVQIFETKEAKQWISEIKFSPDGRTLAVGSHDNSVYLYSVNKQFKRKGKFSKHSSYITHLDFSSDSKVMQTNCGAYELLFSDVSSGKQIMKSDALKDVHFDSSWTCPLGWPVLGIWAEGMDGTDINAVDVHFKNKLLATGDDFGKVTLFIYPCIAFAEKGIPHGGDGGIEFTGHSSHVTCVRWVEANNHSYLISTGGEDKCVFQWKCHTDGEVPFPSASSLSNNNSRAHEDEKSTDKDSGGMGVPTGGDEFMAVKPWLGAIISPTVFDPDKQPSEDELKSKEEIYRAALGEYCDVHQTSDQLEKKIEKAAKVAEKQAEACVSSPLLPDDEFDLHWVHGYRGFDSRNNICYCGTGKDANIVYPAAALGIVMDKKGTTQSYFRGHTDDILSMAYYTDKDGNTYIATGQQATAPLYVWDPKSFKALSSITTKQKSIVQLAFSGDGKFLVSIAIDNSICVSDWKGQRIVAQEKGDPATTFHIAAGYSSSADFKFLAAGDKFLRLWTLKGRNLTSTKVSTSGKEKLPSKKKPKIQRYLTATEWPEAGSYAVGCEDGTVYLMTLDKDSKKSDVVIHHIVTHRPQEKDKDKNGAVTAMHRNGDILVTGAKDGSICVWQKDVYEYQQTFRLGKKNGDCVLEQLCGVKQISALFYTEGSLLVGTKGCEIVQISLNNSNKPTGQELLLSGHCDNELWGLACHPTIPEVCSVGDDKTLRFWDLRGHKQLEVVALDAMARAVCYYPQAADQPLVAVGFGGRVGTSNAKGKLDGMVRVYFVDHEAGTKKVAEVKDPKRWMSDVRFSPDGKTLAVGGHDDAIYFYDVGLIKNGCTLKLRTKFSKHNSFITHIDFSADSKVLQSNCGAYELLFSDVHTGKQITKAKELRDVRWSSWTCCLGWPVQSIWQGGMDGSDINAVDRSHSSHLVAVGDDSSHISVYRYPCIGSDNKMLTLKGHSSHVMNVRWSAGDEYLLSAGGNDKCIMQWKHYVPGSTHENASSSDESTQPETEHAHEGVDTETTSITVEDPFASGPSGGDESTAVQPWRGAIRPPSVLPNIYPSKPTSSLSLKWVHGFTSGFAGTNGARVSANLRYNYDRNPVFPAAALGVVLKKGSEKTASTQVYFEGHDDDVLCLCISADRRFVATGQTASKSSKGKGSVCIWDATDCRLLSRLDGCHQRGVSTVAFSPDGHMLLTTGQDNNNQHSLWKDAGGQWSRVELMASEKGDQNPVMFSKWIYGGKEDGDAGGGFVTGGGKTINFWKIDGATISKKPGKYGAKSKVTQQPVTCAANLHMPEGWRVIVGNAKGDLVVFGTNTQKPEREAITYEYGHDGPVLSLMEGGKVSGDPKSYGERECNFLVSGGKDGKVKVWNRSLGNSISQFNVRDVNPYTKTLKDMQAQIGSIDVFRLPGVDETTQRDGDSLEPLSILVGTYGGDVVEIVTTANAKRESGSELDVNLDISKAKTEVLQQSHYGGELWGLAVHPTDPDIYATAGDDGLLRIYSVKSNAVLCSKDLGRAARALAWHPKGDLIAIGMNEFEADKAVNQKGGKKSKKGKGKKGGDNKKGGGDASTSKSKSVHLYSFEMTGSDASRKVTLTEKSQCCKSTACIADIKFSDNMMAVGSHDKHIYMFDVPEDTKIVEKEKFIFNKHSSAVLHIDFSEDGAFLQSNCQAYELLFMHTDSGKQETKATSLADLNKEGSDNHWATQTCILGWPVQGIWAPGMDGSDINSVDRDVRGKLLASGDDFGQVKLFNYPVVKEDSQFNAYDGHSSHVTNVRWTADNTLVSTGGNDKCVMVWELKEN